MTEHAVHYHPRTDHLPDRRQTYLHLPGVRPNYGPCPGCGAEEDTYCEPTCDLSDPYSYNNLSEVSRCFRCLTQVPPTMITRADILVLPHRPVKHVTRNGTKSLCGQAARPKAALYRNTVW